MRVAAIGDCREAMGADRFGGLGATGGVATKVGFLGSSTSIACGAVEWLTDMGSSGRMMFVAVGAGVDLV